MNINKIKETKFFKESLIVVGILTIFTLLLCVNPFATDGYTDINNKNDLANTVATAISNHETEILIDYNGENYSDMKSWFKSNFSYDNIVTIGGEYAAYNYNGSSFTYWSYSDKKRVKVDISYKESLDEKSAVDSYINTLIDDLGLSNMSQYDAIKTVHDYFVNNIVYTGGVNKCYDVITTNKSNCYGYTILNYLILDKLGINIRTTYGKVNESHIWNSINLDGQWYYEDITWDTTGGYNYFLISTTQIKQTHTIIGNFIPDCPNDYILPTVDMKEKTEEVSSNIIENTSDEQDLNEIVSSENEVINYPINNDNNSASVSVTTDNTSSVDNDIIKPSENIDVNIENVSNQIQNKQNFIMKILNTLKDIFN